MDQELLIIDLLSAGEAIYKRVRKIDSETCAQHFCF